MKQENFSFFNFHESKLLNDETTLSYFTLANYYAKHENKRDDTSFPQMGEEGCGSFYPTCSLLSFTMLLKLGLPLWLRRSSMQPGERGWRREENECFLEFETLNFFQCFRLTCHEKWKTIELFSCKTMD